MERDHAGVSSRRSAWSSLVIATERVPRAVRDHFAGEARVADGCGPRVVVGELRTIAAADRSRSA
ncbi:hypothetical protein ACFYOT_40945 [Saccharothrix saharensis]|uniref:hypothetical protein n=1 Tax=Saccharothrix saharensis TaxID=571190 RepID=UPI0036812973